MISRHWHCIARRENADDYIRHLQSETWPGLGAIPGFIDGTIHRRDLTRGTEFVIVTRWESIDSLRKFAGVDPEVAVVPQKIQSMLIEFDGRVRHYEVVG